MGDLCPGFSCSSNAVHEDYFLEMKDIFLPFPNFCTSIKSQLMVNWLFV